MPKIFNRPPRDKRVGLSLDAALNERLVALANLEGKPPAVLAREILSEYLDARQDDIEKARSLERAYLEQLKNLRTQSLGLIN